MIKGPVVQIALCIRQPGKGFSEIAHQRQADIADSAALSGMKYMPCKGAYQSIAELPLPCITGNFNS
jgi:hypothetical protein